MSHDVTLQAITTARAGSETVAEPKVAIAIPAPQSGPAPAPSPIINPSLRLDAALGLVVIEFRNDSGAITTSIPSQRQLQAYQRWETTRFGPAPAGRADQTGAEPSAKAPRTAAGAEPPPAVQGTATPVQHESPTGHAAPTRGNLTGHST